MIENLISKPRQPEAFVVGIDGGQTSTKGVLATLRGRVLAQGTGGPILHMASRSSEGRFTESVSALMHDLWERAGVEPTPLQAITLGLTGAPSGSTEAGWAAQLTKKLVPAERVQVHSDAFTALKGAHAGRPGVIVISGTGMIAMGLDMRGGVGRCGGWGWVLGDEGSAFAIGGSGLRAALNAYDGAAPTTVLVNLFLEHFQVARMPDIKRIYMNSDFRAPEFGRLAAVVSTAARRGDEVAKNIIDRNSLALAQAVIALVNRLEFGDQEVPTAPFGGAFDHIHGLMGGFKEHLKRVPRPRLRIVNPEFTPAVGALIIALESCGASLGDVVPAIRDYYAAMDK